MGITAVLAVGALLAAGCGGGVTTVTETVQRSPSEPPGAKNADECRRLVARRVSGRCQVDGTRLEVAAPGDTARLEELAATLVDVEFTGRVSGGYASAAARGRYVVARLEVTNRTDAPQELFGLGDVAYLRLGPKSYSEDFDASNGPVEDSFINRAIEAQPGERVRGALVFDVPAPAAHRFEAGRGALIIANFSDIGSSDAAHLGALLMPEPR